MIFACALYPRDDAFLSLIKREISEQVSRDLARSRSICYRARASSCDLPAISEQVERLSRHASIVVWGGSNENEFALTWYNESKANRDLYLADYVKLYLDTMRPALAAADPDGRPFVDSSPSNGLVASEPYVKRWDGGTPPPPEAGYPPDPQARRA